MKYMGTVGRSRGRTSQAEEKASAKAFQQELSWFALRNKKKKVSVVEQRVRGSCAVTGEVGTR